MSVVSSVLRELMAVGVEGDALIAAIERVEVVAAEERSRTIGEVVAAVSARLDANLPPYDPEEHRRALQRERQRRYQERLEATGLSSEEWRAISTRVIARDGGRCQYCETTKGRMVCDHVHPLIQGGTSDEGNLVCACASCNSGKAGRTVVEWRGAEWAETWRSRYLTSSHVTDWAKENPQTPKEKPTPIPPLKGGTFPKSSEDSPEKPKAELGRWVTEIWNITPQAARRRSGRPALETALRTAVRAKHDPARIKAGLEAYYASPDATKQDGEFAAGVHVAIRQGRWEAFAETEPAEPTHDADPWPSRLTRWNVAQYWNSDWGPKPGREGYLGPSARAEEAA